MSIAQNSDFNIFCLVILSFDQLVWNLVKWQKKKNSGIAELHNMISYNDVTFDAADHVKQINCDQISLLL